MIRPHPLVLPILLAALFGSPKGMIAAEPARLPKQIEEVFWWLPEDTETAIVAQQPFTVPDVEKRDVEKRKDFNFLRALQLMPSGMAMSIRDLELGKAMHGHKVVFAVEGGRKFRDPRNLGSMRFEGAEIVRFHPDSHEALRKAFHSLAESAPKTVLISGERVPVFTERREADDWSFFVVQPEDGLLIAATERDYLGELLRRRRRRADRRALPEELPEWRQIDLTAPVWAVRHYRKKGAEHDPSSPLGPQAAANIPDPEAIGFVFWFDEGRKTAKARYLSRSAKAVKLISQRWINPPEGIDPTIKQVAPGVVEISHELTGERGDPIFLFILLGYLGHAVYV